jgi:hypothetical protein
LVFVRHPKEYIKKKSFVICMHHEKENFFWYEKMFFFLFAALPGVRSHEWLSRQLCPPPKTHRLLVFFKKISAYCEREKETPY